MLRSANCVQIFIFKRGEWHLRETINAQRANSSNEHGFACKIPFSFKKNPYFRDVIA